MNEQTRVIWETLEFRTPSILESLAALSDPQFRWQPPNGANSAAWLLWHIAEVEDNWVRDKVFNLSRRYPFGLSVREAGESDYPSKSELLEYFRQVRDLSRERLEATTPEDFDRPVDDEHFGRINVRKVWVGVATSCSWHGGQIVLLAKRLVPR